MRVVRASSQFDGEECRVRNAVFGVVLCIAGLLWPVAGLAAKSNVLLIICDDLNTHVSTSGYQPIKTPALDALAASGMVLRRAYCQYPVCGPSRASFLTGLYPESTGVTDNRTDIRSVRPGTTSLPTLFKENGYWTGGVGKVFHGKFDQGKTAWHAYHKFQNERNPVLELARRDFEARRGSIDKPENRKAWRQKQRSLRKRSGGQSPPGYGPTGMTDAEHKDGKNARQIVDWLEKRSYGDKPFFMVCGIHKPHVPFWAPRKYFEMYPKASLVVPPVSIDDWKDIPQRAMVRRFRAFGFELGKSNEPLSRSYIQAYHACISFVDTQIGLVLTTLERTGRARDTIVVLISDHGYHLGEHSMWGKVTLFEECARVPMIVRVPGRTIAGTRSESLVELVDVFPTLSQLCEISMPEGVQGHSFVRTLERPAHSTRDSAYTVVTRGTMLGRSIRTKRWRYAEWGSETENELYDLTKDPAEQTNLARQDEFEATVVSLRKVLRGRERIGSAARPATRKSPKR